VKYKPDPIVQQLLSKKEKISPIIQKILDALGSGAFEKWYAGDFVDFIGGMDNAKSKDKIIKDIKKIFKV